MTVPHCPPGIRTEKEKSMMITLVKISDMREVALVDLDQMSQDQGLTLATAVADLLIRSGTPRDAVPLSGPQWLQFLSALGAHLAAQRVAARADESSVGKECDSQCRSRWSPYQ